MSTRLKITGMNCQHCVRSVTQALEAVAGVEAVRVDLSTGIAEVQGQSETEALIAAVTAAGYGAEPA